jgi:hypothetical protein
MRVFVVRSPTQTVSSITNVVYDRVSGLTTVYCFCDEGELCHSVEEMFNQKSITLSIEQPKDLSCRMRSYSFILHHLTYLYVIA